MTDASQKNGASGRIGKNEICRSDFSTPIAAPFIPPFPFSYRNAEILTVAYRTRIDSILALVPETLEVTSDVVVVHIYRMHDVDWLGPYGEANIMIGAKLSDEYSGGYSPWLFLSSASGVSQGREVHGQPKKDGEISLKPQGDLLVGRVRRNGIDVVTATLAYKQRRCTVDTLTRYFDFGLNLNLKVINHIDGRPAIRQITARRLTDVKVHECWDGPCTVELRPNAQAPVHRLPVIEMLEGIYWRADFTLVEGQILVDYLE